MANTTTIIVITHEVRENIMGMMREVIAQEQENRKWHIEGD